MSKFYFFKPFRDESIARKLYFVVGTMAFLIIIELGTLFFAVNTLSSVRAFVGAEGLWSKSQKDAVYNLQQYSQTHRKEDEQAFYNFMKVPLSYHNTISELFKDKPDTAIAREGLLEGGNHPEDINGMIKLFIRFKNVSYIDETLSLWAEADSTVVELIPIAKELHAEINSSAPSQSKLYAISNRIEPINQKLTLLENDFSYTLGEGARSLENSILTLLFAIALTVGFTGLTLTYLVVRAITKGLKEITIASGRVAKRDFSVKAQVYSNDEIGVLANAFNAMTEALSKSIQDEQQANQELEKKTNFIQENERRIVNIMDALIKTTQLDFSQKLLVSDRRDELDAIAVGFNTMSEELESYLYQIRKSEEKLNDAQHIAHIGSWEWNIVTNTIEWSDELYRIYGLDPDSFEATYENYLQCIHPEDREYVNDMVQKAYQDHQPLNFFHRVILPNGEVKILHSSGKVNLNKKGELKKMIGTAQDVTESKKNEEKINQYTDQLESKNKELAQFAYAASHDLQEPLRTISNFSRLLSKKLETLPDDDMKHYIRLITGGANRMSKRIFDLLDYSRLGKDMSKSETDCNIVLNEVLIDLSTLIEESGAEINIEKLPIIICGDLAVVFQNLIVNAIKFKKADATPVMQITGTDTGKEFLFTFKDNGIGIDKDYYDKVFVLFQRLHTRTEYEGTGIGLSLCKKVIELHGGTIWVESELGVGSTFYFTIPKS